MAKFSFTMLFYKWFKKAMLYEYSSLICAGLFSMLVDKFKQFFSICNTEWLRGIDPNFQKHSFLADVFILFTPWKYQKAFGFLMILGGTTQKWEHGPEMGERNNFNWLSLSFSLALCLTLSLSLSPSLSYSPVKLVLIAQKSWLLTHSKH